MTTISLKRQDEKVVQNHQSLNLEYRRLRDLVGMYFDERVWLLTEAALSVMVSCLLADTANPLALILVDGPSTEKTTVLDFFNGLDMSYRLDKFTPASFLSQAANVSSKELSKVDLLPKIVYKTVLIPEMAPTFNQPKEALLENYAILARVLDGSGYTNAGGIHGTRELKGDYLFGILGATTPLNKTAWNTMGKVGSRLLFLHAPAHLSRKARIARSIDIMANKVHYKTKIKNVRDAIGNYLDLLFKTYNISNYKLPENVPASLDSEESLLKHCGYLPRTILWNRAKDDYRTINMIASLAEFITTCRSDIRTWTEEIEGLNETDSTGKIEEGVDRFTSVSYNLARCHAILTGRDFINTDDLSIVVSVALSSLPDDRRKAIEILIEKVDESGTFTIKDLIKKASCSDKTARELMTKLEILGVGKVSRESGSNRTIFTIHKDYHWLVSEDFRQYYRPWEQQTDEFIH